MDDLDRADISVVALAATWEVFLSLLEADVPPPKTWLDVLRMAQTVEILYRIHRLAADQSTASVRHIHLTDEERRARMAQLRAMGDASRNDCP
jgi:hypothetical protein